MGKVGDLPRPSARGTHIPDSGQGSARVERSCGLACGDSRPKRPDSSGWPMPAVLARVFVGREGWCGTAVSGPVPCSVRQRARRIIPGGLRWSRSAMRGWTPGVEVHFVSCPDSWLPDDATSTALRTLMDRPATRRRDRNTPLVEYPALDLGTNIDTDRSTTMAQGGMPWR